MRFEVQVIPDCFVSIKRLSKRYRSFKKDFKDFSDELKKNPFQGDEIAPGVRKIRMAITSKGRGKSGGARVITYTVAVSEASGEVYIVEVYDKSDSSSVVASVIKEKIEKLGF